VVNAIVQTGNGLLWVGTQSGLASFNGRDFASIDLSTAGSPSQGAVHSLLESSAGDLWVGTDAGVVCIPRSALDQFSPSLVSFYHPGSGPSNEVYELAESQDGAIWAGTSHGLYRRDAQNFKQVIPAVSVSRIAVATNGHLLLVTDQGYIEWDGHRIVRHPGLAASFGVHEDQIFAVFQDHTGTMWYGTNNGIRRSDELHKTPLEPATVAKTAAFRIYQDYRGSIWIATGVGLYRLDATNSRNPRPLFKHVPSTPAAMVSCGWVRMGMALSISPEGWSRCLPRLTACPTICR